MTYFYCISSGEFSDYEKSIIAHTVKYTNKEFVEMYNTVIMELLEFALRPSIHEIVERMADKFGFHTLTYNFEICCETLDYEETIPLESVAEDMKIFNH